MTTTTRTIEEILRIRQRAAELRVLERAMAILKVQAAMRDAIVPDRYAEEMAGLVDAKTLADDALTLVKREIEAQQGLPVDPVAYDPAAGAVLRRYAAVLMLDDPQLTAEQAETQAGTDEGARFQGWQERFGEKFDDEEDEDGEA
ncbi:hypothetical protein [Amycolatopsis sp. lyj-23]|uniref:hypothetical protein n=1 Tax=Amycolatopsis sp. lyj-23 TaxID=2789283 RepID=UPI00397E60E1